jgi:hypothetical protein
VGPPFASYLPLIRKWRHELSSGEVVEGAEAAAQLVVAQAPLAVQLAYKLLGRPLPLLRVAIYAAGHQVSIGIPFQLRPRHNVVEAPPAASASKEEQRFRLRDLLRYNLKTVRAYLLKEEARLCSPQLESSRFPIAT